MQNVTSWADRPEKDPLEILNFELDWGPFLDGRSIDQHGADFIGLTELDESLAGDIHAVTVGDGVKGVRAYVDFWVTTTDNPALRFYRRLFVVVTN